MGAVIVRATYISGILHLRAIPDITSCISVFATPYSLLGTLHASWHRHGNWNELNQASLRLIGPQGALPTPEPESRMSNTMQFHFIPSCYNQLRNNRAIAPENNRGSFTYVACFADADHALASLQPALTLADGGFSSIQAYYSILRGDSSGLVGSKRGSAPVLRCNCYLWKATLLLRWCVIDANTSIANREFVLVMETEFQVPHVVG